MPSARLRPLSGMRLDRTCRGAQNPTRIDVSTRAKQPMETHAKYKYLVNLEGQG